MRGLRSEGHSRESQSSRRGSGRYGLAAVIVALVVWSGGAPVASAQMVTCTGSDAVSPDCNGNNTDDHCDVNVFLSSQDTNNNDIPDECEVNGDSCFTNICDAFDLLATGSLINNVDCNQDSAAREATGLEILDWDFHVHPGTLLDSVRNNGGLETLGSKWRNPNGSWTIGNGGCPSGTGRALKGVAATPPLVGNEFLVSEYFNTDENGVLACTANKYKFTADLRVEASLNPRIDWQISFRDASDNDGDPANDPSVMLIHLPSTLSSFQGVAAAQRGRVLVRNPDNPTGFLTLNPPHVLQANTCFRVRVEVDNTAPVDQAVKLFINETLRITTKRISVTGDRIDYIRVTQVANGQASGALNRLGIDNITVCEEGPALDWDDCNFDCINDLCNLNAACVNPADPNASRDCNASLNPDECENQVNCSCEDVAAIDNSCIWCNHSHAWGFESSAPNTFALGNVHGQRGWRAFPPGPTDATIVSQANPFPYNFLEGVQTLRLGPVGFGSPGESVMGPPTRSAGGADAGVEFWEIDAVMDNTDDDQQVFFVIWDQCNDYTGQPDVDPVSEDFTAWAGTPFTAGVMFRSNPGGDELWVYQDDSQNHWLDLGPNRLWFPHTLRHVLIQINNNDGSVKYWANEHRPGCKETQSMGSASGSPQGGAGEGGDREALIVTRSEIITSYWDNFKYSRDDDCDCDGFADSVWLPYIGGAFPAGCSPSEAERLACYDTNNNRVLDWCEDCNNNGRLDTVDISGGTSQDCNANGLPDECDIDTNQPSCGGVAPPGVTVPWCVPGGGPPQGYPFHSRRGGGSLDLGGPTDCTPNNIPDECDADCNNNGIADGCDISAGTSVDVGGPDTCAPDGIPDECQGGCNNNGVPDACDISLGTSDDCNLNSTPDECDALTGADCQPNGVPDECELTGNDCDNNGVPDQCDAVGNDCNANQVPDVPCELSAATDCQPNGVLDECDILGGTSLDIGSNGIPDECEGTAPNAAVTTAVSRKANSRAPGFCDTTLLPARKAEMHQGGVQELRIGFNVVPGSGTGNQSSGDLALFSATCAGGGVFAADPSLFTWNSTTGTLVVTFAPALANTRTYRLDISGAITSATGQQVFVRGLAGDVDGNGFANAVDRSLVVGAWTSPAGFTCESDIDNNGVTNAVDRSLVVGAWTAPVSCAP